MNINSHKKLLLIFWHISSVFFLCVYLKRKNYPQLRDINFQDIQFSLVQSLSRVRLFVTPWIVSYSTYNSDLFL